MRKILLMICLMVVGAWATRISGTYTVGTGKTYATWKAAKDAFNLDTLSGDLTFLFYYPITETTYAQFTCNLNGHTLSLINATPHQGLLSSPAHTMSTASDGIYLIPSGGTLGGRIIIDGLYIKVTNGVVAGVFGIRIYAIGTSCQTIIRNCMINGKGGYYGGINNNAILYPIMLSNRIWNCVHSGIYFNSTPASYLPAVIANNSVYNCDTGIVCGGSGTTKALYSNNICLGNIHGDFIRPSTCVGAFNVSSDTTCSDAGWKTGSSAGYSNGNIVSKTWDSVWQSVDTLNTNFMCIKVANRSKGLYTNSEWFNSYVNGEPVADSAIDYGSYGFTRNRLIIDTNATIKMKYVTWPAYGNLVGKFRIAKANPSFNNILFKNLLGDTLPMYVDSTYGTDSAVVYVRSKKYLSYNDSILMYYGKGVYSSSDRNSVYAKIGFGLGKSKLDSVWNFHNMVNGDVGITTDTTRYDAWPGFAYSLDKKKAYFAFRSCARKTHGYDSTGFLRMIIRAVDSNGILGATLKDTAISKTVDAANCDWRENQMNVFNRNGVELCINTFNTFTIVGGKNICHMYLLYSTDGWNTMGVVKTCNNKQLCSRSKPLLLSNDTLMTVDYDYNSVGNACSVWVSKAHVNNFHDSTNWTTAVAFASPNIPDTTMLNESEAIELKTGSKYVGKMVMISRSDANLGNTVFASFSYDYGRTWNTPITALTYAIPTPGGNTTHIPWDLLRLGDGHTIVALTGQRSGCGGFGFVTNDEFTTCYQLPRMWMMGLPNGNGRLYPALSEFKNKRIGVAWCTNADPGSSQINFNYYNLNGQLTMYDTNSTGWINGYKPPLTDSGLVFGKSKTGQNGITGT